MRRAALLLLLFLIVPTKARSQSAEDSTPPNVLLLLVDDLKPAIHAYGDPIAKTPNLDRLVARGMRFDRAYCNQAVCAPSRFTLMLGSHSTSTGLYGLGSRLRESLPDAVTMPQYFSRHGYRTESLGKVFHIGHGNEGDPESFDVPHFHEKVIEYVDPASTDGGKLTREEAYFTNQQLDRIGELPRGAAFESPDVPDTAYADGRVANETITRLEAAARRRRDSRIPFFIAAGFARPHLPFSAPKQYWDLYDPNQLPLPAFEHHPADAPAVAGKRGGEINNYAPVPRGDMPDSLKRQLIHGYYASVSYVDAQLGKVLDAVDQLELTDNTIIVLWGDHGFHLGDLGIWTKHTNYEQANRIPLVFIAPGITPPGATTSQPAESVDVFPTLAALCGLPQPDGPQPIDGVNLVPVLQAPTSRVRDHAYHAYPKATLGRAIRTERFRLVEWKSIGGEDVPEYELYDYQTDPMETRNLVAARPDVVTTLKTKLAQYPAPASRDGRRATVPTPEIAGRPVRIHASLEGDDLHGVVLAQGGNQMGYALHFDQGHPCLDLRIAGHVTRLRHPEQFSGKVTLEAGFDKERLWLRVADSEVETASPGLIPNQPIDALSLRRDERTAAGDYQAPNPLRGQLKDWQVTPLRP